MRHLTWHALSRAHAISPACCPHRQAVREGPWLSPAKGVFSEGSYESAKMASHFVPPFHAVCGASSNVQMWAATFNLRRSRMKAAGSLRRGLHFSLTKVWSSVARSRRCSGWDGGRRWLRLWPWLKREGSTRFNFAASVSEATRFYPAALSWLPPFRAQCHRQGSALRCCYHRMGNIAFATRSPAKRR